MNQAKKIPQGYHSVTPYLIVKNASEAIEYYKKIFSAKEHGRMMTPDGKRIAHAEIEIGDSKIMLADEFPEMNSLSPESIGGSPVGLFLYVEDVDKIVNNAINQGAKELVKVEDQFWGDRYGSIEDPFGHRWSIATHIKDLTEEEMKKAAEDAFTKMYESKTN